MGCWRQPLRIRKPKENKCPGRLGERVHPPAQRQKTQLRAACWSQRKEAGQGRVLEACSTKSRKCGVRDGGSEKIGHKLGGG